MPDQHRLCEASLDRLPAAVRRPAYARGRLSPGILHLGLGAFARAHLLAYVDGLLADTPEWGVVGASLRGTAVRDALAPQDGLYTMAIRREQGMDLRVIGALTGLIAPDAPGAVATHFADPTIRVCTITVTEKGYCRDPASGALLLDHPDILHDLAHPDRPRSLPGHLVAGLALRRAAGLPAPAVLSCDNLPGNGDATRRVVVELATRLDEALGRWIAAEVAFPNSMVDRIVPATTDADRAEVAATLGLEDAWPVVTEEFTDWVVEDRFPLGRPAFERQGVTLTDDAAAYERIKLRLVNAAHSALVYLSVAAGVETVAEAMRLPGMVPYLRRLWAEAAATLALPAGFDLDRYTGTLEQRFADPAIRHRTAQIARDGSQKLPQRLVATIRERLARGLPSPALSLAVAAWMRHVTGRAERGPSFPVEDAMAAELARRVAGSMDAADLAPALAGIEAVFGHDVGRDPGFVEPVTQALAALLHQGTRGLLAREAAPTPPPALPRS